MTWDGHVELVRRWADDSSRGEVLAQQAEKRLAQLNVPKDSQAKESAFPRLSYLHRALSQNESLDELKSVEGADSAHAKAAAAINGLLTSADGGTLLSGHNEVKLNNPIISGIGVLHGNGQNIFFEDLSPARLDDLWSGTAPKWASAGAAGTAPEGSVVVPKSIWQAAQENKLPIVILDGKVNPNVQ